MRQISLLSSAYFPPADYFCVIADSSRVLIEREENYHKQTYRNRCIIMASHGSLSLVVPVMRGSFHKTAIKELRIDNSRRWQDLHLRGIRSAYAAAPYFEYYFDLISDVITGNYNFLLDLNMEALRSVCGAIGLEADVSYTGSFSPEGRIQDDFRYCITPKRPTGVPGYTDIAYTQVFSERHSFIPRLSIIDLLLNNGPGTRALLLRSPGTDNSQTTFRISYPV
jgi:hypothetical protein